MSWHFYLVAESNTHNILHYFCRVSAACNVIICIVDLKIMYGDYTTFYSLQIRNSFTQYLAISQKCKVHIVAMEDINMRGDLVTFEGNLRYWKLF